MSSIGQGSISIDDSTRIGENAQDTANKVAGNVNDINSDNKLTPSEKLKLKQEYDKDVELYNIDTKQLHSVGLPTAELETAMSNLTKFVTPLFNEMNKTSTIDRDVLNSVFTAFAVVDKNAAQAFVNMVQQVADDAKKAGDDAKVAGGNAQKMGAEAKASAEQAKTDATQAKADALTAQQKAQSSIDQLTEVSTKFNGEITEAKTSASQAQSAADNAFNQAKTVGSQASSAIAVQSAATAKAQSTADSAFTQAKTAIDNGKVTSQAVTDLKDGSTLTIAQLGNGLASKVASSDFASYKTQTANQIGQMVTNSNFSAYQQTTADLISNKVATKDFSAYQATTAKAISSKVESSDFNTYKTQTANLINDKVSSADYTSDKKQTADMIDSKVSTADFTTYQTQTANLIGSKVANSDFSTYKTQTANLISSKVDNNQYQSDKTQTANLISQTVTDAVNNINVGGRNYLLATGTPFTKTIDASAGDIYDFNYWYSFGELNKAPFKNGIEVMWSFDWEVSNMTSYGQIEMYLESSPFSVNKVIGSIGTKDLHVLPSATNTSGHVEVYVTVNENFLKNASKQFKHGVMKPFKGTLTFKNVQLMIGNKPASWTPAPEDFATSTEIDQINNAINLKANSSDVTSQINVAIQGVQTDVTNKVSNLTTQINQTSDAVQILNTTSGLRNLVYNSSYANNAEGWNMFGGVGYLSTAPASSYNGSPGFGVNVSGKGASTWTQFGQSKNYALPSVEVREDNTYSASAMIKMYNDSDSTAKLAATIAYFDKNDARISCKDMFVTYDSKNVWTEVKFENLPVPKGAYSICMQFQAYGSKVHGMIAQPMIVFGPNIGPYNPDAVSQSDITASINNINLGVKNADGSTATFNMNGTTILMDTAQTIINGKTSILDASIDTAKIANAAINTAQIADGAINNAKIANASIDDAKINSLNGNKLVENSITANKINVDDLIANGINTKTLTSVDLNTSTLNTPQLNLGLNGTFTEDFDYTQPTSMFLPKKNKGTLTFNHGVLQSKGRMQTYVGGQWGGMNDSLAFQSGIDNAQWTEVAPGYIKLDLFKQNDTDVLERTYIDPTGYYYTSRNGTASYLGNVLQVSQVQTPSVFAKYVGPTDGKSLLQIGSNGDHYGLQVGPYAGNEAVLSDFIYNSTTSGAPNVNITENGHLVRSTSASKYKYNIKNPDIETTLGDRLLNVHLATWNDKRAVDLYAEQLSTGEEREKTSIDKYYGLIAEQLRDAGLDMFINYGKNHEIEGIQYDRAWVPLLSVIRRLNDKVNEYELRISKLEGKINE